MKTKLIISVFFLLWLTIILALFFIVQKPVAFSAFRGLAFVFATVMYSWLFAWTGAGIGYPMLAGLKLDLTGVYRLILATGTGMGMLGLIGFGMVAAGVIDGWQFFVVLLGILGWSTWKGSLLYTRADLSSLWNEWIVSSRSFRWIALFALVESIFVFLLSLAPVEAFDGLFYHLVVPLLWLRDGGVQLVNMPHYWFPSLMEGMFVWPLSFGLDSTPQLIHLIFGFLSVLLVGEWSRSLFNNRAGWWSIAIFLCMPSLPWLASWAYTDLGLIFYTTGTLFALLKWKDSANGNWLFAGGIMAGFAVGIKYTSFVLPLFVLILLFWWTRHNIRMFAAGVVKFGVAGLLTGFPWYLRNWILMGNPFYPFVFGGPFWDAFRAEWYAGVGSGIGWDPLQIVSLPFVVTLGYRDVNFFDGRIGPLYLVLSPLVFFVVWKAWKQQRPYRDAVLTLFLFSISSMLVWTFGVIKTNHLMQSRLLWPGLIPLMPLMSAGILELEALNIPKFKLSFIFSVLTGLTIFAFLLDFSLLVMVRNPIMVAIGLESREGYISRMQPSYAQAVKLVNQTPLDSFIYLLNEPRSYGIDRHVQTDAINDNLPHDFHVYATNEELIAVWRELGYTHVLIAKVIFTVDESRPGILNKNYYQRLNNLMETLVEVDRVEMDDYILLEIPSR